MSRFLVTGGAGYIGSHTVRQLTERGDEVVVCDDLSAGHPEALPGDVKLVVADLADEESLTGVFAELRPDAVVHFAGSIEAGESAADPRRFYRNNLVNSIRLLDAAVGAGRAVPVVFSSTAAVYGNPDRIPITEGAPTIPTNVYGDSKLAVERVLAAYDRAYGLRSMSLRYFNACGAQPDGSIGADHRHKTHLVTLAMLTALGQRDAVQVFGTDYPTADGTGVRDYIHVCDLAAAHLAALDALLDGAGSRTYNVGLGRGFSVGQVLDGVDRVTGRTLRRELAPRREGDPVELVADATRLRRELGWEPQVVELDEMLATAWCWHRSHPYGYAGAPPDA